MKDWWNDLDSDGKPWLIMGVIFVVLSVFGAVHSTHKTETPLHRQQRIEACKSEMHEVPTFERRSDPADFPYCGDLTKEELK